MLPVKTPKVPTTAPLPPVATVAVTEGPALFVTAPTNKRASLGDTADEKFVGEEAEAPPAKTAVISKLLPNMKR